MADIVGTASAVAGLIGEAITLIQLIQAAHERIKGASTTLNNVSSQLNAVSKSLSLVKNEPRLQEPAVDEQVQQVVAITEELDLFFKDLEARQKKGGALKLFHALKEGDKDDKKLAGILTRLSDARGELSLRISVVHVGITGNIDDGFRVATDVVMEINDRVSQVLERQLVLAERLENRQLATTSSGVVELEDSDIEALGLRDRAFDTALGNDLTWSGNVVGDDAEIAAGNIGYTAKENQAMTPVKAKVEKSNFGKGLRFISGHIESAEFLKRSA